MEHHGEAPTYLCLITSRNPKNMVFTVNAVNMLRKACPNLEIQHLVVPRSQGDAEEVTMYKALGGFPRVHTLHIIPDASHFYHWTHWYRDYFPTQGNVFELQPELLRFDEFGVQFFPPPGSWRSLCNGNIRNALINSAWDEHLARSVSLLYRVESHFDQLSSKR
ncbi:hypothetical protein BT63DRAFT_424658 [Microthyrium microscopicum]|uniref:Uncharacterized protein n=1 Tax=Microthyrium microscopicum TaxID=703497 RepID=A0A6A6U9J9_9PEZI|nr:hypothetical protein BT63DRAFT_424658 [Microthyrium microscopicum]